MLVFGWLLFGLAGLFAASAVLSMGQLPGTYVTPLGALNFLLTDKVNASKWPWASVSLEGVAKTVTEDTGKGILGGLTGGVL